MQKNIQKFETENHFIRNPVFKKKSKQVFFCQNKVSLVEISPNQGIGATPYLSGLDRVRLHLLLNSSLYKIALEGKKKMFPNLEQHCCLAINLFFYVTSNKLEFSINKKN